jgi:hypothetical protein
MDSSLLSAFAALTGAAIGGASSFLGAWSVHRKEIRAQWISRQALRRQELYKEFIEEAAKCYIDALQRAEPDVGGLVAVYARMSRMRVISSPAVLAAAEAVLKRIMTTYSLPPLTITCGKLEEMVSDGSVDLLRAFSEACRSESYSVEEEF